MCSLSSFLMSTAAKKEASTSFFYDDTFFTSEVMMHIKASVFSLSWWWTQFPSHQISFSCCTHLMGSLNSSGCEFFIIWWCRQLIYLTIKNRRKKYLRIIIKAVLSSAFFSCLTTILKMRSVIYGLKNFECFQSSALSTSTRFTFP